MSLFDSSRVTRLMTVLATMLPIRMIESQPPTAIVPRLIRRIDASGTGYSFSDLRMVRVAKGQIFALDREDLDVKVFDESGTFLRKFARRGSGPGELLGPAFSMEIRDSSLVINDLVVRREVVYSLQGKHLNTRSFARSSLPNTTIPIIAHPLRGGGQLSEIPPHAVNFVRDLYTRLVYSKGTIVDTVASIRNDYFTFIAVQGKLSFPSAGPTRLGKGGAWVLSGDSLLLHADGYSGIVRWIGFGPKGTTVVRTENVAPNEAPVTPRDFEASRQEIQAALRKRNPGIELQVTGFPQRHSVIDKLLVADDGSAWVAGPPVGKQVTWTVFSGSTRGRFQVVLPSNFNLTDVSGSRLYGISQDADDLPVILVFDLRRS